VRFRRGLADSSVAEVHARQTAQLLHTYRVPSSLQLVRVPAGMTVEQTLDAYRSDPEVLYAEPNLTYALDVTPNDPLG
jgi:hypothetical protein